MSRNADTFIHTKHCLLVLVFCISLDWTFGFDEVRVGHDDWRHWLRQV